MAAAAPPQIVLDAMIACGCDNAVMWNGETAATRIASNVFDDDFSSCMDNSFDDLDQDLNSYASLTAANGQIRLNPRVKKNIRGFIQWCRDRICCNEDPSIFTFLVDDVPKLI